MKQIPCMDCARDFPPEAMDFDHVKGQKRGNVSDLVGLPWRELELEVQKCEVVCASCHRLRTMNRRLDAHLDLAEGLDVLTEMPED